MKRWLIALLCPTLLMAGMSGCGSPAPTVDGAALCTLGDSITALSTWPQDVAASLNMHLINAGIGGHTSADGLARFERDVAAYDPDFVIISFGSNDFHRPDGTDPKVTAEDYAANLEAMIEQTKAIDAVPLLMTPPFISPTASGGAGNYPEGSVNEALDVYVDCMRAVADKTNTALIDIHAVCDESHSVQTVLGADGVHLSAFGNQMYKNTICDYFNTHFTRDTTVDKVTRPTAPTALSGTFRESVIRFTPDAWRPVFDGTVTAASDGKAITFTAEQSGWPEIHYSPAITDAITVPVADTTLHMDATLVAATNISLFLNGTTPTLAYSDEYVSLTDAVKKVDPTVHTSGSDISAGQTVTCSIPLKDIIPLNCIAQDGTVVISGVKVFVVGGAGSTVTIRELSVSSTDG